MPKYGKDRTLFCPYKICPDWALGFGLTLVPTLEHGNESKGEKVHGRLSGLSRLDHGFSVR